MYWIIAQTDTPEEFSVTPLPEEIYQPAGAFDWLPVLLWGGIGSLLLAALIGVGVWLFVRVAHGKRPPRLASPGREALFRIEKVRSDLRNIPPREVATEMADTVKVFLSRKLGLDLVSRTGGEFMARRQEWERKLSPEFAEWVVEFLNACDQLKFAGGEVTDADKRRIVEQATSTVQAFEPAKGGAS